MRSFRWTSGVGVASTSMPLFGALVAVAAASILARAVFVERLAALGREVDLELPKGAS